MKKQLPQATSHTDDRAEKRLRMRHLRPSRRILDPRAYDPSGLRQLWEQPL